jgi:hypothetical protein
MELFTALRRLDKKVWMLQYDHGLHGLDLIKDRIDFTIRMTQFFDHYLKDAIAPKWMTQGIPAGMKGLETGYEPDPQGRCSVKGENECLVCDKWNIQYKRFPNIFNLPPNEWRLTDNFKKGNK